MNINQLHKRHRSLPKPTKTMHRITNSSIQGQVVSGQVIDTTN